MRIDLQTRVKARRAVIRTVVAVAIVGSPAAFAGFSPGTYFYSTDITVLLNGLTLADHDVIMEVGGQVGGATTLPNLPAGVDISALHREDSGTGDFLVSFDTPVGLPVGGGQTGIFFPADIVVYEADTMTYAGEFFGSIAVDSTVPSVDAVTRDRLGRLVFSFDTTVVLNPGTVGEMTVDDEDLVVATDFALEVFWDGDLAGVPSELDVDAAHVLRTGNYLVSFDGRGVVGSVSFEDEDVLEFNTDDGSWVLAYRGSAFHPLSGFAGIPRADIDAWFVVEDTPTATPTNTPTTTQTPTATHTWTPTSTATHTLTWTPTATLTWTATQTTIQTPTNTSTATATLTATHTSTSTQSPTLTLTPTVTSTATHSVTPGGPTMTPSQIPTETRTATATATATSTATITETQTASQTHSPTVPLDTPSTTATRTSTATATETVTPGGPTLTPTASATATLVADTATPTEVDTLTPTPVDGTETPTVPTCVGDCDGNGTVTIAELIRGVNIALGSRPVDDCPRFDRNGNGEVSIDELIAAVNAALGPCS